VHVYIHVCILYTYGRADDVYIYIYIYYETRCTCIYTYVLYTFMGDRKTCIYVYIYIMRHGARVYTHMYFRHILERGRRRVIYSPFLRRWDDDLTSLFRFSNEKRPRTVVSWFRVRNPNDLVVHSKRVCVAFVVHSWIIKNAMRHGTQRVSHVTHI